MGIKLAFTGTSKQLQSWLKDIIEVFGKDCTIKDLPGIISQCMIHEQD